MMSVIELINNLCLCFMICVSVTIVAISIFKPILYSLIFEDYHILEEKKEK